MGRSALAFLNPPIIGSKDSQLMFLRHEITILELFFRRVIGIGPASNIHLRRPIALPNRREIGHI
jgi:hypothetical protein